MYKSNNFKLFINYFIYNKVNFINKLNKFNR